jgi:hypothetical protein
MASNELTLNVKVIQFPDFITMQSCEIDEKGNMRKIVYRSADEILKIVKGLPKKDKDEMIALAHILEKGGKE